MHHLGSHYLAEFHGCDAGVLNDMPAVERAMLRAADLAGATVVQPVFHQFSPHGVSGVVVVAESHFAIHTWPEHGYAAVDLFTCGHVDHGSALAYLQTALGARDFTFVMIERGLVPPRDGEPRQ